MVTSNKKQWLFLLTLCVLAGAGLAASACPSTCNGKGTCTGNATRCNCTSGFYGFECESTMCDLFPCKNGGACNGTIPGTAICSCLEGTKGKQCENFDNPCNRAPCAYGNICSQVGTTANYTCHCALGRFGLHCEFDVCNLSENLHPCQNGGVCLPDPNSGLPICQCDRTHVGVYCEQPIDACTTNMCQNGGYCMSVDGVASCLCLPGFNGTTCETSACATDPCGTHGTCAVTRTEPGYLCTCQSGYTGTLCDIEMDACTRTEGNPCGSNGNCNNLISSFNCTCVNGYTGTMCNISPCNLHPCLNGGTCSLDTENSSGYQCACVTGMQGATCETQTNLCSDVVCANGGTCVSRLNGFRCACAAGFEGIFCNGGI